MSLKKTPALRDRCRLCDDRELRRLQRGHHAVARQGFVRRRGEQTIALVNSNSLFYQRLNPVDIRLSKLLRFGGRRLMVGVDLYNAFNGNTVVGFSNNFGNWLTPTTIQQARVVKFSGQLDF